MSATNLCPCGHPIASHAKPDGQSGCICCDCPEPFEDRIYQILRMETAAHRAEAERDAAQAGIAEAASALHEMRRNVLKRGAAGFDLETLERALAALDAAVAIRCDAHGLVYPNWAACPDCVGVAS